MTEGVVEIKLIGFQERELSKRYACLAILIRNAFSESTVDLVPNIVENLQLRPNYARQLIDRELAALQTEVSRRVADYFEIDSEKIYSDGVLLNLRNKLIKATAIFEIMDRLERMAE